MSVIAIGGVQEVGTHALVTGATYGSIFTIVATGTVGQSAIIQGSIDQEHWVDIATFTIDPNEKALSAVLQFTYKYLQVTGDAKVKIARGSA